MTTRRFRAIIEKTVSAENADETAEQGKRARGHVQISALIPPAVREDLKMGLAFDPQKRDLSELITDLLKDWADSLPAGYQSVRPSRRVDDKTAGQPDVQKKGRQ